MIVTFEDTNASQIRFMAPDEGSLRSAVSLLSQHLPPSVKMEISFGDFRDDLCDILVSLEKEIELTSNLMSSLKEVNVQTVSDKETAKRTSKISEERHRLSYLQCDADRKFQRLEQKLNFVSSFLTPPATSSSPSPFPFE